jgi:regulator of sigma E protease
MLETALNISLLALGFGFVIFWHELGHFLAAKYVGIKVEQFAVGFGQALLAWRKGIGIRIGTTRPEYERRVNEHLAARERSELQLKEKATVTTEQFDAAAGRLGLGETEYRLNWIPLGGYVKMLGQDDMNPNALSEDPRAYPQKSVGARMLVISAGVIMNIILAAILFMALFMMGHKVPPAVVGGIYPGSPAQHVTRVVDGKTVTESLQVGDEILFLDGKRQDDWTKVSLTSALADPTVPTTITVRRPDNTQADYQIMPARGLGGRGARDFLQIGIDQPRALRGPDPGQKRDESLRGLVPADYFKLEPGDEIVAVDGTPVDPGKPRTESTKSDFPKLDAAVQAAGREGGRAVKLEVRNSSGGATRTVEARPRFMPFFGGTPLNFAGLLPRTTVQEIQPKTPAAEALRSGDVVVSVVAANDPELDPTFEKLTGTLNAAGQRGQQVELTVLRDGKPVSQKVTPSIKTKDGRYVLGFAPGFDADHPVVAGTLKDSPAERAGIRSGATLTSIGGKPVSNWYDVHRLIADAPLGQPVEITATKGDQKISAKLTLAEADRDAARDVRYNVDLALVEQTFLRKARNPLHAAWLGVTETRDFILQFYVTLQRMFGGSISYTNLMGPLGIFESGRLFAARGMDWLIWFLAMISANLAVVNFLPIPVVDGGHFVFLCLEKIQGKPVSQRMQSIAQVVGLALLLGVFLLVTYQDISRMVSPF